MNETTKTPTHLWVVGILALLWMAMGGFDYVMSQTQNEAYMGNFTQEQRDFVYGMPAWAVVLWAISVWGGVLGAVLLLMRKQLAVWVFLVALIAYVLVAIQNYGLSNGMDVFGSAGNLVFSALIGVVCLFLFLYSRSLAAKGVLT